MTSQMMAFLTDVLVIWSFLTGQAGDIGITSRQRTQNDSQNMFAK